MTVSKYEAIFRVVAEVIQHYGIESVVIIVAGFLIYSYLANSEKVENQYHCGKCNTVTPESHLHKITFQSTGAVAYWCHLCAADVPPAKSIR